MFVGVARIIYIQIYIVLCHLQTMSVLLLFQFRFFVSFYLISVARSSDIMLDFVRVGIFVLILILEEMLSPFHHLVGHGCGKYSYSDHHFVIYRNIKSPLFCELGTNILL